MNKKLRKLFGSKPIIWVPMWGISKLRGRGGRYAGEIPGEALWYDQWYERAMSRENAEKLASLGVNLVILPFSLGASASAEKAERDDFEKMTRHLHEFGMVSLPYLQYQNMLQEENVPEGSVWAETLDGKPQQYCYWRRTVCQSSRGFMNYFKQTFSDAIKRGADGIWIDNNYLKPCKCELCSKAFVEYLEKNCGHLLNTLYLDDFSSIEIPPLLYFLNVVDDPIVQAFIDFNCDRNMQIHHELKKHLESINADAIFASNPALFRGNSYVERGVDFYNMFKVNDLIYLENKFFPEEKAGQTSGNYHGFVVGGALGTPAIPGAWKKADFDATSGHLTSGLPKSKSEIERALLEAPVFGGVSGAFWAVRNVPKTQCATAEDQLKMYYETPGIYEPMRETLNYIKSLPVFGERRNLAEIAVLHHQDSMKLDFDAHHAALHGIEELLMTSGIPHNILHSFDLEEQVNNSRLVILPEVRLLSESETAILEKYVNDGGRILILGRDCGFYDESRRPRLDTNLRNISGVSCFGTIATPYFNNYGQGMSALIQGSGISGKSYINMMSATPGSKSAPNWLNEPDVIIDAINKLLAGSMQIKLDSPSNIAVTIAEIDNKRIAVQLFSYADNAPPELVNIQINLSMIQASASLYRFGQVSQKISSQPENSFTIPDFQRHAAFIFEKNDCGG
jgi:hypothetical protein